MTAFRFFMSVLLTISLFSYANAQDGVAGPWSVINEEFASSGSGTDVGGSSNMGTEDDGGGITFDDNTNDMPIDGGLSLLLAAGAAYGARRLRRRRD